MCYECQSKIRGEKNEKETNDNGVSNGGMCRTGGLRDI